MEVGLQRRLYSYLNLVETLRFGTWWKHIGNVHYRDGRDSRFADAGGSRKVEVVSNSVLNGNWGFGTTDMFLDRSHMLLTRNIGLVQGLYFEGQVPE